MLNKIQFNSIQKKNCRERPLIKKTGWGTTERERGGQKEGGRMQCFMKTEDKSLIDVENVETTYFDNCAFFAVLASFLLLFCLLHLSTV